jgi:hypothetical protein
MMKEKKRVPEYGEGTGCSSWLGTVRGVLAGTLAGTQGVSTAF